MNRNVLFKMLLFPCLVLICIAFMQHRELFSLRSEQQRLLAQLTGSSENYHQPLPTEATSKAPVLVGIPVSRDLLQLRNQVNMLTQGSRELAEVRSENQRLKLLLAERQINGLMALPPGYVRKSQARMVGYNTPQDTLQTLLWAMQSRNATNVLLTLTPEQAEWYQSEAQRAGSFEKLFEHSEALFGFSIIKTDQFDNRTLEAEIELAPGLSPLTVSFQKVENEWKLTSLP